jgi:molecular chaperone GrpE
MTARSLEEMATFRERWLRCAADLENLRKRTSRDIERSTFIARKSALLDFLDVVDSLERAISLATEEDQTNSWYQGMKAIHKQLLDTLSRQGARPFESLGERFDPHRHEAVSCIEDDGLEEGIIVEVTKTGYEMSDGRLLRAAAVVTNQRNHHDG